MDGSDWALLVDVAGWIVGRPAAGVLGWALRRLLAYRRRRLPPPAAV